MESMDEPVQQFTITLRNFLFTISNIQGVQKYLVFVEMFDFLMENITLFNTHPQLKEFKTNFYEKLSYFEQDVKNSTATEGQLQLVQKYIDQ